MRGVRTVAAGRAAFRTPGLECESMGAIRSAPLAQVGGVAAGVNGASIVPFRFEHRLPRLQRAADRRAEASSTIRNARAARSLISGRRPGHCDSSGLLVRFPHARGPAVASRRACQVVVVVVLVLVLVLVVGGADVVGGVFVVGVVGAVIGVTVWVWVAWPPVLLFAVIVYRCGAPLQAKGTVSAPVGPE
jgi:Flp pilus assembly protein TadB